MTQTRLHELIVENLGDVVALHDAEGRFLYVSPSIRSMMGYEPEELLGRRLEEFLHPRDIRRADEEILPAVLRDGMEVFFIHRVRDKDGGWRSLETRLKPLDGQPEDGPRFMAVSRDITPRLETQQRLRVSEERLRQVVRNMPVMLGATGENNIIVAWNKECERVTGYSAAEMVGRPDALEMLYPDPGYRQKLLAEWAEKGDDFLNWETELTAKDGTKRTVAWSNISGRFPIPGWQVWAVGVDVTERKRAEAALKDREALFHKALEKLPFPVIISSADEAVHYANPQVTEVFGYRPEEVPSRTAWLERVYPDEEFRRVVAREVRDWEADPDRLTRRLERRMVCADGTVKDVLLHSIKLPDGRFYSICQDITEAKRAEAALKEREALFRQTLEHFPFPVIVSSPDNVIHYQNPKVAEVFGYRPEEIPDRVVFQKKCFPDDKYRRQMVREIREWEVDPDQPTRRIERPMVCADGTVKDVMLHSIKLPDGRYYSICQDITEMKRAQAALKERETLFRQTLEHFPFPVIITSPDDAFHYLNPKVPEVFGYQPEEIPDRVAWRKKCYPDEEYRQEVARDVREWEADPDRLTRRLERKIVCADGTVKDILVHAIKLPDGRQYAICQDVTEMKRAEAALKDREALFRQTLEHFPFPVIVSSPDDAIHYVNPKLTEVFGYRPEDIPDRHAWLKNVYPDEEFRRIATRKVREWENDPGRPTRQMERAMTCRDGTVKDIFIHAIKLPDGRHFSICYDITETKRAAEELRRSQARWQGLIDNALVGIFRVDREGRIIQANPRLGRIFGFENGEKFAEVVPNFGEMFLNKNDRDDLAREFRAKGYVERARIRFRRPDGEIIWGWLCGRLVEDENGERVYEGILVDVTAQKLAEEQLEQYRQRLEELVAERTSELKAANKGLQEQIDRQIATETELRIKENQLQQQTQALEEANAALKVLLDHQKRERDKLEKNIAASLNRLVVPYLDKMTEGKLDQYQETCLKVIRNNLGRVTEPYAKIVNSRPVGLSPRENEVANLVREGKTSAEIADLLSISENAVSMHRKSIRKKLNIRNKKVNLSVLLNTMRE